MSIDSALSNAGSGTVFGDIDPVKNAQAALQSAIQSGAIQAAANYGQAGAGLLGQTQAAEGNNVSLNSSAVDADSAALAPVQAHYLQQFQNGGLAGKAAVEAAQAQARLNAQGGLAGIHADTLASGAAQQQVANVAQNEINNAGSQTNTLDAQKAAIALQKAVFSAKVSHANLLKNMVAENTNFNLRNSQQELMNTAQSSLNDISNQGVNTDQQLQKLQNEQGQSALNALLALGGRGVTTGVNAFGSDAQVAALKAQQATPTTASKVVVPSPGMQSSAFTTAPILPNTANAWNGGY